MQVSAVLRFLIRSSCENGWLFWEERKATLQQVGLGLRTCLRVVNSCHLCDVNLLCQPAGDCGYDTGSMFEPIDCD